MAQYLLVASTNHRLNITFIAKILKSMLKRSEISKTASTMNIKMFLNQFTLICVSFSSKIQRKVHKTESNSHRRKCQ